MRRFAILSIAVLAAAVFTAAACTTKGENSALVTTKVVTGTASGGAADAGAGTPIQCKLDAAATELTFIPLGPDNFGQIGVGVDNRLSDPSSLNTIFRTNSADFLANHVVVSYEVIGGGGSITANATPPASGVVPAGNIATVGVVLFPSRFSAASAGVAAGSFIRATLHVE